jgi:hypothetical protein
MSLFQSKWVLIALLIGTAVALIGGCGDSGDSNPEQPNGGNNSAIPPSKAVKGSLRRGSSRGVTFVTTKNGIIVQLSSRVPPALAANIRGQFVALICTRPNGRRGRPITVRWPATSSIFVFPLRGSTPVHCLLAGRSQAVVRVDLEPIQTQ